MKHSMYAALIVLGLIGVFTPPTYAARDDSGHTPAKPVDVKTRLMKASLKRSTYDIEGKDWNVAEVTEIRTEKFHAPTPRFHPLAGTLTTRELHALIIGPEPTVLIDVLGGKRHRSVPGALWLKGAGWGGDGEEDIDRRLEATLDEVTDGDKTRSIVFFSLETMPCRFVLTPQALNAHTDGNRFRRCASAMAVQHGRTSQWFVPVAGSGSRTKV